MFEWLKLRMRALFRKNEVEKELDEELRFYLEHQIEQYLARGMSQDEARSAALRDFGGVERAKEQCRDARGVRMIEELWHDVRYGFRRLCKIPLFSLAAIVTLALGIGANTAIFGVANAIVFRALPYQDPDRLVTVSQSRQAHEGPNKVSVSPANFRDWREQNQVFTSIAGVISWTFTLTGQGEPEEISGGAVSFDTFSLLGVRPALGRGFTQEEDQVGAGRVAILGHSLWKRRFGADPTIIGKSIALDDHSHTVVGVMPTGFKFPLADEAELWTPLAHRLPEWCGRSCWYLLTIARLRPGISPEQAQADLSTIAARLEQQYPQDNRGIGAVITSLHNESVGDNRRAIYLLMGAVTLVLLIACANVANLLLARAATREKELAICSALGAGRGRLVRQMLTENMLLALAGGALGLLLAFWIADLLPSFAAEYSPRAGEISIDGRVLVFACGITLLTGVAFGLIPALQASVPDLINSLKEGGRGGGAGLRSHRSRNTLIVTEVALALMLLIGAGLLMKSFLLLQRVDLGVQPQNVLTFRIALSRESYPKSQQIADFYAQLIERLKVLPGIQSVAATGELPLQGGVNWQVNIEGRQQSGAGSELLVHPYMVTPDYFRTMGIRLLKGRAFTRDDDRDRPLAVIINEAMARSYFPGEDPLGRHLGFGKSKTQPWQIVGVVADVKQTGVGAEVRPAVYLPHSQSSRGAMKIVARTIANPLDLVAAARNEVWAIDRNVAISEVKTMENVLSKSLAQPRFLLLLIGFFAAVALTLAVVGIYSVMNYAVTERTREIGIRLALGAQRSDVLGLIVRQGLALTLIGVFLGLLGAFALTRVMSSLLFKVSVTDPITYAIITLLLVIVAMLACYLPARRAMKVDPIIALRHE